MRLHYKECKGGALLFKPGISRQGDGPVLLGGLLGVLAAGIVVCAVVPPVVGAKVPVLLISASVEAAVVLQAVPSSPRIGWSTSLSLVAVTVSKVVVAVSSSTTSVPAIQCL